MEGLGLHRDHSRLLERQASVWAPRRRPGLLTASTEASLEGACLRKDRRTALPTKLPALLRIYKGALCGGPRPDSEAKVCPQGLGEAICPLCVSAFVSNKNSFGGVTARVRGDAVRQPGAVAATEWVFGYQHLLHGRQLSPGL